MSAHQMTLGDLRRIAARPQPDSTPVLMYVPDLTAGLNDFEAITEIRAIKAFPTSSIFYSESEPVNRRDGQPARAVDALLFV